MSKESGKKRKLDSEKASQSLWLVKLPVELANQWSDCAQDDLVGNLVMKNQNGKKVIEVETQNGVSFVLDEIVQSASLQDNVFSFDQTTDKSFRLLGKVTKRYVLRSDSTTQKANNNHSANKRGKLLSPEEIRALQQQASSSTLNSTNQLKSTTSTRTIEAPKLTAAEINQCRVLILEALKTAPKIAFAEIEKHCKKHVPNVADKDIRDILNKYAIYHNRGDYRGLWEIKPEYRDYTSK
jgi:hypothetical protein